MARGRDAADVAIATTFGPNTLESFQVWTDEIAESAPHVSVASKPILEMRLLTVRHITTYRYSEPVGLGEHRHDVPAQGKS